MSREQLQDWVQIVGILAVVGSLVFVGLQIRQATETRDFEGALTAQESSVDWLVMLAEHGDIWPRGCAGEHLNPEERYVFRKLARAFLHSEFWAWLRGDVIGKESIVNDAVNTLALNIHSFKGLRQEANADDGFRHLITANNSRLARFATQLEERLDYLARVNPNPEFDAQFCGE